MMMPASGITSSSGQNKRVFLASRFQVDTIVTNFAEPSGNMSEGTSIHECIAVYRRTRGDDEGRPTRLIKLDRVPESEEEARRLCEALARGESFHVPEARK